MKSKLKKIFIPFILMLIFNLGVYYLGIGKSFGLGYSPHVGVLLISGLLLGPYGAIGSVFGNFLCDLIRGYGLIVAVPSAIIGFGISYLAYKLWYEKIMNIPITKPRLNDTSHILLFFAIILICSTLYAVMHQKLIYLTIPNIADITDAIGMGYFLNFINSSFIFGIIGIWLSKKFNVYHVPEKSKKKLNKKLYSVLGWVLIVSTLVVLITGYTFKLDSIIVLAELIFLIVLLFAYLTKPFTSDILEISSNSIPESVMQRFFIMILILAIFGFIISSDEVLIAVVDYYVPLELEDIAISMLLIIDVVLLIFLIPSLSVLRYIENRVINPLTSFSQIENFIHENQKIETEGLLDIYSPYMEDDDEIGTLARSYTNLINHNNSYIENIREIEGEKERIKAELDIATRIQQANLPTEAIDKKQFKVNGYSRPAKEVGGDFFDYYKLDEDNLALVIGDASGKGVPAALLATITQVIIKQLLRHEKDPSKVLFELNNQICENNSEVMFITLWLGIYNKATHTLTFSNAGHNPPLIKHNNKFEYLMVDEGIVLGILEDFEFKKDEIKLKDAVVVYTDGITDANNKNDEMFGEERLINFFNNFKSDSDPILPLLDDINDYIGDCEQFDDMTLLYLKIKDD